MPTSVTRRSLIAVTLRACGAVALGVTTGGIGPRPAHARRRHTCRQVAGRRVGPHPDPRPGIDASHIMPPDKVRAHPDAVAAFDDARNVPEILDGIRCQCGCADQEGMRSLLSCYEGDEAMALHCDICQGQARLAFRLHGKGQALDQIRAAIDARYGS